MDTIPFDYNEKKNNEDEGVGEGNYWTLLK